MCCDYFGIELTDSRARILGMGVLRTAKTKLPRLTRQRNKEQVTL